MAIRRVLLAGGLLAAAGLSARRSGEGCRRDLGVRAALMTGTLLTIGLAGLAFHVYLDAPYNRVECARDGYPPHRLACSYHNRNTPVAHRQAGYLMGAGFVALVGTLGVLGWAEKRRLLVRGAHTAAAAHRVA